MKMGFDLSLEQVQKLIMTPELRQAIEILQLPAQELRELINEAIETNPLLEREESKDDDEHHTNLNNAAKSKEQTIDWKEYLKDDEDNEYFNRKRSESYSNENNDIGYENLAANITTLQDHLTFQLHLSILNDVYRRLGEFIIESLDSNGYFRLPLKDVAHRFKVEDEDVENVLYHIQTFDPPGVAARSLEECLILQLKHLNKLDDDLRNIILNHLEDVAANRMSVISKAIGLPIEDCQQLCDIIRNLEPKPGRSFQSKDDVKYITPDVIIDKVGDEYIVTVTEASAPRLSVSPFYRRVLQNEEKQSQITKYLNEKLDAAMWIIKSIEQRRVTLIRVVKSIIDFQRDFFDEGMEKLKPLNLRDVADVLEIHESTVSRAIKGKYAQTPRGTYPLKFFFSTAIESTVGADVSTQVVKKRIREIIEFENPKKPISDQKIADMLVKEKIDISRRTVAKYRDELNIPATSKRKRY